MKLTGDIVCAIIKTCAESGVMDLSVGSLKVSFRNNPTLDPLHGIIAPDFNPHLQDVVTAEAIERDELALREDQLAQMEIEDPVGYEKAISAGDLIDSKVGDETDEEDSGPE